MALEQFFEPEERKKLKERPKIEQREDYKRAKEKYLYWRTKLYSVINRFDSWDEYKNKILYKSTDVRFDKSDLIQRGIDDLRSLMNDVYFAKYPFFKKYNPNYEEFDKFISKLEYYEKNIIHPKGAKLKYSKEVFNITEDKIFYPNIRYLVSAHSGLHSLATIVYCLRSWKRKNQLVIYFEPLLTHPGDREYLLYFSLLFDLPVVILKRLENLAWLLQVNMLPTLFSARWCTRTFKIEPNYHFCKNFFCPPEYKLTKKQYREYIAKKNQKKLLGERISEDTRYVKTDDVFEISKWDNNNKKWYDELYPSNIIPMYEPIYKHVGFRKRVDDFKLLEKKLIPDNVIEMIGIATYQSPSRAKMNPNVRLHPISQPEKNFRIYQHYPIFYTNYEKMIQLIRDTGFKIRTNPYEKEYSDLYGMWSKKKQKETRFGCVLCPHKSAKYYYTLKEKFPEAYFFAQYIRLVGSVQNIFKKGTEYFYFRDERDFSKQHPEYKKVMPIM